MKNVSESSSNNNIWYLDKHKLESALEGSNTGLWEWDAETNKVSFCVEAKRILGYNNSADLSEINWKDQIHPDDLKRVELLIQSNLRNRKDTYKTEHRKLCKDGTYKWFSDSGTILERDKLDNPKRAIGTLTDISIRKNNEEDLVKNLDIITDQNKRLKNFAHVATHNLKEYAGNFESLLSFYDEAETETEKKELIKYLKTVSKSLTKTIASLNDIVTKQSIKKLKRENLNVYEYIEKAKKLLEIEISKQGAIINNNVDKNLNLYSNSAYLESIIQNLGSNALKYAHPDRKLVLNINSHTSADNILTITVADNGIGMDLTLYGEEVFDLYRTFHGNENAEGVGLYITKNQVETLGGKIQVSSKVNVGTTFTITVKL